jgi:hypothetical protein
MPKISRKLELTDVRYGLLYISGLRELFPSPGQPITIIDSDGERFPTKMHSSQSRIDGLMKLHRKHNSQVGQTVIIEVSPDKIGTAQVEFGTTVLQGRESSSLPDEESEEKEALLITASLESMLEDFIANNLSTLEPGLRLFEDEDAIPGRQYPTEVGTIDLLCVDPGNDLVVIELKKGRESDRVVGQISRYIGWVKANIAKNSRGVRGIIVVGKPTDKNPKDERLSYAVLANPNIELRYYEITLSFFERGKTF